jgi:hypothetical protein
MHPVDHWLGLCRLAARQSIRTPGPLDVLCRVAPPTLEFPASRDHWASCSLSWTPTSLCFHVLLHSACFRSLFFPAPAQGPSHFFFDSVQDWLQQSVKGRSPVEYAFDARCHRLLSFTVCGNNRIVSRPRYLAHQDMIGYKLFLLRLLVWSAFVSSKVEYVQSCRVLLWDSST